MFTHPTLPQWEVQILDPSLTEFSLRAADRTRGRQEARQEDTTLLPPLCSLGQQLGELVEDMASSE